MEENFKEMLKQGRLMDKALNGEEDISFYECINGLPFAWIGGAELKTSTMLIIYKSDTIRFCHGRIGKKEIWLTNNEVVGRFVRAIVDKRKPDKIRVHIEYGDQFRWHSSKYSSNQGRPRERIITYVENNSCAQMHVFDTSLLHNPHGELFAVFDEDRMGVRTFALSQMSDLFPDVSTYRKLFIPTNKGE